ncbi:molybdopterin-synthase adenylyltransferase [Enterobacter cloacae]|uniref:Molybdopterin-synthase adenylyltransferase n=1 Tax=Enterobacter cloacae TaxID=550 RepID=A0A377M6H7_ENTCL|nr:molybdopterin-synthase adenylyltransferase [Enterobacter cloacae]
MAAELSDEEMMRYNRQIVLRGFDFEGQEALKAASVLVVGLGGLGCAAAQYLAAAGVGKMTLLDFDTVSVSNCSARRCTAMRHSASRRVDSARAALTRINPTFSSPRLTRCWMTRRYTRKSQSTIWCWTVLITSPSATS